MIRRLLRACLLPAALVVALLAVLFWAMDFASRPTDSDGRLQAEDETAAARPQAPEPVATEAGEGGQHRSRSVSPDLFGQPFTITEAPFTRIAPRPPLSAEADETVSVSGDMIRLFRPVVLEAGRLSFAGRPLELKDLESTSSSLFCDAGEGPDWPCGMVARTSLRNYLRGRAVQCDVEDSTWDGTAHATCLMGRIDIAQWLASSGWAIAAPGSEYEGLSAEAREEGRGLFGPDPR